MLTKEKIILIWCLALCIGLLAGILTYCGQQLAAG